MRRILFNGGFIAALFPVFGLLRQTISGKRGWRLWLAWAAWALSLVVVVSAITDPELDADDDNVV